jgi:hypothetical protein
MTKFTRAKQDRIEIACLTQIFQPEKLAVLECSIDMNHCIRLQEMKVLATTKGYMDCLVTEVIEMAS